MRYALISDVHSNLEALTSTLEDIDRFNPDKLFFLGDAVGYGADPNACVETLVARVDVFLGGNHDWAVTGRTPADYFNPFAREAVDWTIKALNKKNKKTLGLTRAERVVDKIQIAHSTPMAPGEWRYIMTSMEASDNYRHLKTGLCFIGHSHQPLVIEYKSESDFYVSRVDGVKLDPKKKYIVNIGSVGQPRDANPDSSWVLYDSDDNSVTFHRVAYDLLSAQRKMVEAGLPEYLVDRLSMGR